MANGDAAAAAGMAVVPSTALLKMGYDEINKTRDYIAQRTFPVTPILNGGTGATTAGGARTNLGIPALAPPDQAIPNGLPTYNATMQLTTADPTAGGHAASKGYVDARIASIPIIPDNPTFNNVLVGGALFTPNAYAATSGYTIAYINSDGRLSKGASSRRYKKYIHAAPPLPAGLFPTLQEFQMRGGDGSKILGYIAEDFAADDDLARFVVFTPEGAPDAIDHIQFLLAQVSALAARVAELEAR